MPGADLPEAQRNQLLRRVDWRFLLPVSQVEKAVCFPDGDLREGLALVAGQVVDAGADHQADCDLAVAINPDAVALERARAALVLGGVLYAEWHTRTIQGVGGIAGRLQAAGFGQARAYLAWPSSSWPYTWVPLGSPGAIGYFRRHLHARSSARTLGARILRTALTLGAQAGIIGPLCFVARKSDTAREEDAEPELFARIRQGWGDWGLAGAPNDLAIMLLTRGPRTANKIAGLVFAGADTQPRLVVKIARVADARPGLLREATTLPGIQRYCRGGLEGAPRVLFTVDDGKRVAVGETALPGVPMLTRLSRRSYRSFALQATDWLVDLARCERGEDRTPPACRLIDEALAEFVGSFGSLLEPELVARTRAAMARLDNLASVCEHRDFSPWNVFVTPHGGFAVFDWESSEPAGLPGLDLHYFLAYLAFALDRARQTPAMLRSYRVALDPTSFTGAVHRECLTRYAERVGLEPAAFHPLRLLTWIIHSRSECRRLTADAAGAPPIELLRHSLFLELWRAEALRGGTD
ncbi:MAG: phosphotransferase family protein [Gemmatimonadales bacterium]